MGLYLFGLVMIVMNLAAFGVPSTSRRAQATSGATDNKDSHQATGFGPE